MTVLVCDVETDGLLAEMTRLWLVQIGDADTEEVTIYADMAAVPQDLLDLPYASLGLTQPLQPLEDGIARLKAAESYVFHNGLGFDLDAVNKMFPGTLSREKMLDTLVMARLQNPQERDHRLGAWGRRLGILKGDYKGDFQAIDRELLEYSAQDIVVGRALYHAVKEVRGWGRSCDLEHLIQHAMLLQERNGFTLDIPAAERLSTDLRVQLEGMTAELQKAFPPIEKKITFTPKVNNKSRGYVKGVPFTKTSFQEFNPGSRLQIAERLVALGWKPKQLGDSGVPTVDESVLKTLSLKFPKVKLLAEYFTVAKRLGQLSDGKQGWLKLVKADGRVHGRVNPCGARTGRMAHSGPNMAQVDKKPEMRSCWIPRKGWKLVGVDGEGIQARALGHYLEPYDGGLMIKRHIEGKKELKTDVHSANFKLLKDLGVPDRDGAKEALYAKMFGSTTNGLARTVKAQCRDRGTPIPKTPHAELGILIERALQKSMVGLAEMEAKAQAALGRRGYLVAIDGRRVFSDQQRLALVTLCQSFEQAIMKQALVLFHYQEAPARGWVHGVDYGFCANVHDEVQIEARPELAGFYTSGLKVGQFGPMAPPECSPIGHVLANCITEAGVLLGSRCPMAGEAKIGTNWAETH